MLDTVSTVKRRITWSADASPEWWHGYFSPCSAQEWKSYDFIKRRVCTCGKQHVEKTERCCYWDSYRRTGLKRNPGMEEMKIKCGEKEGGREEKIERKERGDSSWDISVPAACFLALGCVTVPSYPQRGVSRDERRPEARAGEGEKE